MKGGGKYMAVMFYDVKNREKVEVPENMVKKTTYERQLKNVGTQVRYALRGELGDGRKVTKFVSKDDWDGMSAPTE